MYYKQHPPGTCLQATLLSQEINDSKCVSIVLKEGLECEAD